MKSFKLSALLVLFFAAAALGQTIDKSVMGSGGNTSANANNSLSGTLGQTFIGVSTSPSNSINAGFWYSYATVTGLDDQELMPTVFELYQNYPNPFNPSTKIKYSIPEAGYVLLEVYNLLGEKVVRLVDEEKSPGFYTVDFNAAGLSSGFYLYRIQAKDYVSVKKMILLK